MRKLTWIVLLTALAAPVGSWDRSAGETCQEVVTCEEALRLAARPNGERGYFDPELDSATRLATVDDGVDKLVELLADPNPRLADIAAYGLRNAPAIDSRHLPAIVRGLDRGLGWLPPALARMDSDEAAREAVDRYLVSESGSHSQEFYAVTESGARAISFILDRARCHATCSERTHELLAYALEEMSPVRSLAAGPLMQMVRDQRDKPEIASGALFMIGALGVEGQAIETDLLREYARSPHLRNQIDNALIGIHSMASGEIFSKRIGKRGNEYILRDLAEVGIAGRSAGPKVTALLEDVSDQRVWAATTLGFIGYREAIPALVNALDQQVDPLLVWASAHALARLNAQEASAALSRIAETHWYPPVRDAARDAALVIAHGPGVQAPASRNKFFEQYSGFMDAGGETPQCREVLEPARTDTRLQKLHWETSEAALKRLAYPTVVLSYGAADTQEQLDAGKDIVTVDARNIREHRESIEQTPHVALRVDGGWLVGGDRGEWGGELVVVGDDGTFQTLLEKNVRDLHAVGDRIVAVVGLAHLGLNSGALYEVQRGPGNTWTAATWRVLPGAPRTSTAVHPDGLMIETVRKGHVVVNPSGKMRMARCSTR